MNEISEVILSSLKDVIVVEDEFGKFFYQNHPEVSYKSFICDERNNDEFYDRRSNQWYKLETSIIEYEFKKYTLKKYTHITKLKNKQDLLEQDGKTGLLRAEFFKEKIEYLSSINKQMILAIIDIDDFKHINDIYGHNVGDDVLKKIGMLVRAIFRSKDLLGRFGGDELVFSLIDINIDDAMKKLEYLRKIIESEIILNRNNILQSLTISVGCVEYSHNLTYEDNLEKADEALYQSKENGKNQVNIYKNAFCKKKILVDKKSIS